MEEGKESGSVGGSVDVLVEIVKLDRRNPYKKDPKKAMQKFDVFAYTNEGQKKTKTLTLFDAPPAGECAEMLGTEIIALDCDLKYEPNPHNDKSEFYLSEICTSEFMPVEKYEKLRGSADPEASSRSNGGSGSSNGSNGNGRAPKLTEEQKKRGVEGINRFVIEQFHGFCCEYDFATTGPSMDIVTELTIHANILCERLGYVPRFIPVEIAQLAEVIEKIASVVEKEEVPNPPDEPEPDDRSNEPEEGDEPLELTEQQVDRKREYAKSHPDQIETCTECSKEFPLGKLNVMYDGNFCAGCDNPF